MISCLQESCVSSSGIINNAKIFKISKYLEENRLCPLQPNSLTYIFSFAKSCQIYQLHLGIFKLYLIWYFGVFCYTILVTLITHWEMNDLLIQSQHLEQLIEKYSQQTKMLLQIIFFLVCYLLTLHNSTECERFLIRYLKTQTIFLLMLPFSFYIKRKWAFTQRNSFPTKSCVPVPWNSSCIKIGHKMSPF